jgi:hypothetical protein
MPQVGLEPMIPVLGVGEDNSCLKQRSHCDRQSENLQEKKKKPERIRIINVGISHIYIKKLRKTGTKSNVGCRVMIMLVIF